MQEALTLFDSICNSRWFVKTSIVRFQPSPLNVGTAHAAIDPILEQDRSLR